MKCDVTIDVGEFAISHYKKVPLIDTECESIFFTFFSRFKVKSYITFYIFDEFTNFKKNI